MPYSIKQYNCLRNEFMNRNIDYDVIDITGGSLRTPTRPKPYWVFYEFL